MKRNVRSISYIELFNISVKNLLEKYFFLFNEPLGLFMLIE